MWIAATSGFYSIVQHRDFPDQVLIRARVKKDLESFLMKSESFFLRVEIRGTEFI